LLRCGNTRRIKGRKGKLTPSISFEQTGVLRFVCSTTAFPDAAPALVHLERFIALIGATGDAYYEAVSMGEDGLKRIKLPDLEDKQVVDRLFLMYQGLNKGKPIAGM
jgi:proteasome component ECM29